MLYTCYTSVKILRSTPDDNVYHFKRTNFNIINNALKIVFTYWVCHTLWVFLSTRTFFRVFVFLIKNYNIFSCVLYFEALCFLTTVAFDILEC